MYSKPGSHVTARGKRKLKRDLDVNLGVKFELSSDYTRVHTKSLSYVSGTALVGFVFCPGGKF